MGTTKCISVTEPRKQCRKIRGAWIWSLKALLSWVNYKVISIFFFYSVKSEKSGFQNKIGPDRNQMLAHGSLKV